MPNRLTRDKKIVIHGNSCIILYISMADALEMLQSCTNCYVVFKQELIAPNSYDFCLDQEDYVDGLVQDCSNSSALAVELLQSCTKPSI